MCRCDKKRNKRDKNVREMRGEMRDLPSYNMDKKNHPGPYQASSWFPGHVM